MVNTVFWMINLLKGSLETALTTCRKEFKAILIILQNVMEDRLALIINDPLYQAILEVLDTRSYQLVEFKGLFGNVITVDCMFLPCHVCISEWIHTLWLPEWQEFFAWIKCEIWSLSDCNWTQSHNHLVLKKTLNHLAKLASLAKWLSVCLQTNWLWIQVQLKLLSIIFLQC